MGPPRGRQVKFDVFEARRWARNFSWGGRFYPKYPPPPLRNEGWRDMCVRCSVRCSKGVACAEQWNTLQCPKGRSLPRAECAACVVRCRAPRGVRCALCGARGPLSPERLACGVPSVPLCSAVHSLLGGPCCTRRRVLPLALALRCEGGGAPHSSAGPRGCARGGLSQETRQLQMMEEHYKMEMAKKMEQFTKEQTKQQMFEEQQRVWLCCRGCAPAVDAPPPPRRRRDAPPAAAATGEGGARAAAPARGAGT